MIDGAPMPRAPNLLCAAMPPAPWHIGMAPSGASSRFINPFVAASFRSLTRAARSG